MSNMDYCRFANTYDDLLDCYGHLDDDDLSEIEAQYRSKLIALAQRIHAYAMVNGDVQEESADDANDL